MYSFWLALCFCFVIINVEKEKDLSAATNKSQVIDNYPHLVSYQFLFNFSRNIISQTNILNEFICTGRSIEIDNVNCELQDYLGQGFMVDFEGYNDDIRIKNQKGALFYFGSEYFEKIDGKKIVKKSDFNIWSNSNDYYIDLHKLYDPDIDNHVYCTKIIIPQSLKKDIFDSLNITEADLGL